MVKPTPAKEAEMLTVDRIMRIAAVVVLTTLSALALPSASGAEQPTISLNYRVATAHLTAPGPRVIQATIRGGFTVNSASYMICSSTSRGNTCDKGFIRLR